MWTVLLGCLLEPGFAQAWWVLLKMGWVRAEASLLLTSGRPLVPNHPKTPGKAREGRPEQCVRWGLCVRVAAAWRDGTLGSPCGTCGCHL